MAQAFARKSPFSYKISAVWHAPSCVPTYCLVSELKEHCHDLPVASSSFAKSFNLFARTLAIRLLAKHAFVFLPSSAQGGSSWRHRWMRPRRLAISKGSLSWPTALQASISHGAHSSHPVPIRCFVSFSLVQRQFSLQSSQLASCRSNGRGRGHESAVEVWGCLCLAWPLYF